MTLGLLGTHVAEFSLEGSGAGVFDLGFGLGDAEVDDLGFALEAEHHVLRTHVAVGDVERFAGAAVDAAVRVIESRRDLFDHVHDLVGGEIGVGLFHLVQDLAEVSTLDVVHHQEELTALDAELVNRHDVRVAQVDRDLGLVLEHFDEFGAVGELRQNAFDGKEFTDAARARATREEHLGHAARRELLEKHVFSKRFVLVCHKFQSVFGRPSLNSTPSGLG